MCVRLVIVGAVFLMLAALERGRGHAVVLSLAAENAAAVRVLAQVVALHAVRGSSVHGGCGGGVLLLVVGRAMVRWLTVTMVLTVGVVVADAVVMLLLGGVVAGPVLFAGARASVSVQRLRTAEQPVLVGPHTAVVAPVGVVVVAVVVTAAAARVRVDVVVVVVAVVQVASLPVAASIRFRFLTVLLPAVVCGLVGTGARELAHQPPERLAERLFALLLRFACL